MKNIMRSAIFVLAAITVGAVSAETVVSAETEPFRLSIKHDGVRASGGEETLAYGATWHGGEGATVTLTQDGTELVSGLTGEGTNLWSVSRNGTYVITHQTIENGDVASTLTATFVVSGREIPVGELTIDWGESTFVYDGQPKEPVITVKDGATTLTKDTHYLVEYKDNVNVGTAKAIVKGIEPFSGVVTNTFIIAAGDIGGGGGEEPGAGVIPEGGISKYDATYVYDGEGHTINTQALYAVTLTGSTPSFSFSLDGETGWQNDPFVYTNVGEYVVWYKITAPNYADYKHQAKVTIQPLVLTVTFDANGGSCPMASKTVTHGATYGTLPTPTWTGHIFAGWYTAASGGNEVKDSTTVSIMAPQTLYAHWVSVTGVSAKQRYPWNGLVDIVVAFEGESNDVAKVDCSFIATNSATKAELSVASITRKGADSGKDNAWSRRFVWDAMADVGEVQIESAVLTVSASIPYGCVQLWEGGPYWAECNVGATKPEEYGYYFWWPDTVGYKRNANDDGWISVKDSSAFLFVTANCPVPSEKQLYLDTEGNLVAAYDAATVHLGAPWRMPTEREQCELSVNCTHKWTTRNGVAGLLVTGKGDYASKSIFLPAAGYGSGSDLVVCCSRGFYWSSTADGVQAWYMWVWSWGYSDFPDEGRIATSDDFNNTEHGRSVRPVRESVLATSASSAFRLDCRTGDRVSAGSEELTYSNLWDGDSEATVTVAQDGAAIFTGLTGEGVKTWTVDRNGRYELTHTTYTNGVAGKVETAVFVVEGKEVPVSELMIDWGVSSFVYDGQPKEPVITVKDGATTLTKDMHYLVEYKDNVNVGTAKAIVKGIAPYVEAVTNNFVITKAVLPPGDDPDPIDPDVDPEDPEQRDDPGVRFSAFDYVGVYDGDEHTIDTNALKAAYETVFGDSVTIGYMDDASGAAGVRALPPIVRDAAVTSFWYKVSSSNYSDVVKPCKVAITNRAVTVTVVGHGISPFYDTTEKTVSGYDISTEDGLYDVETMTTFSGSAMAKRTDVGTTSMGLKAAQFANTNPNFAVTYDVTDGGVTIVPRVIGDDDANWDIRLDKAPMYNGEEQNAPIIQVCYVKPDGNLDYIPYELSGNVATNAGNYKVKIIGKGNYSGSVEKDWAIMPRNVTLTSGSAVWEYDGTTHVTNVVEVSGDGFVDGEGATYADFPEVTHVADAATPVENSFTYTLNENTKAHNYVINVVKGTVKMTKRPITLTAPTKSKTYDGTALTFGTEEIGETYAGATGGAAGVRALPAGESFVYSNFASITEAGQTAATFAIADGTALMADYEITVTPGATLTVTKSAAEITVTAKNGEWTYDGQSHGLHEYEATNLGTLLTGDMLEVTFSEDSVVTTPVDGVAHDGVVENAITSVRVTRGGVDVSANYTLAWYPGTLKMKKRPVTLKSKDASKTYDGTALVKHEVEVGGDGFVGDDGASYEFTGTQTDKGKSKNAFTYTLNEGTNAAYYDITPTEGELEVLAADISEAEGDDWQVVLGPALAYNGIAQVQTLASVMLKGLTVDYSVAGNLQTDAGEYEMTLTGQGNFTGEKKVAWSIAPKTLILTAGSGTKVYDGTALSVGTVTAEGFVANEEAMFACTGSQLDVGSSENAVGTITWTTAKASNYAVTKKPGTLTVTARPVTVKSKNVSKPYDGTPLTLTAGDISESYTGGAAGVRALPDGESFVYGDFASRTEAGQTSGTFTITAGANTKLANYAITPVYGTITITKSATEIGVTAASETWTYDGEAHSNRTWTATNLDVLQPGEEVVVTFKETSVVSTPKDGPAADGKVANEIESIRVVKDGTQDVTDNYTVTPYPGLLTVEKRPVTVTVTGKTVTATYNGEEYTASGYDISTEDELYDIAAKTSVGGTAEVKRTDVGKTEMGLRTEDFTNSDENFEVTYAVEDGSVTIEPADITIGAEGDFVITLGANPKYNGMVQAIPVAAVTYKGLPVTCDLAGEKATHAGTYTLTVKAKGNFTGERSVTWQVLRRQVTLTSGSASRVYNGQPLVNGTVTVSGDGFIGVEGATFETSGSQTAAGSSKNTFAYTLKAGTLAGDYDITKVEGDLTVTKATFDPHAVFPELETATEEEGILCERVFNGRPQPFAVEVSESFVETYEILYAVYPGAWSSVAPTLTNVSEGDLKVFFRFVTPNFEPYEGFGTLRIVPMELTDEMVHPGEDAFFFDGDAKKPTVDVVYEVDGKDICTESDYELVYGEKADAGWWVTVTGKGNYTGTITKIVPVLKRPVAPPVYQAEQTYSGSRRRPSLKDTDQYIVVSNEGGIEVGIYTFTLRLKNPSDYKWKDMDEEVTDYVGTYRIKKATNLQISTQLADSYSWTNGVQKSTLPARINTRVAGYNAGVRYRVAGSDLKEETDVAPTVPGRYVARYFWLETENYEAYSKELPFEIFAGPDDPPGGDHTTTTPVPVPYKWLAPYLAQFAGGKTGEAGYEAAGNATGVNGVALWESYVAGLDPTDALSRFTGKIKMSADNLPIVSWQPALNGETSEGNGILKGERVYRIHGKVNLEDKSWTPDIDPKGGVYRFYKITVELPKE